MKGSSQLEFVDSKRIPKSKGLGEKTLFDFLFINNCLDKLKIERTTKILNNLS